MYLCPSKAKRRSHPRMTKADYKVQGRHTTRNGSTPGALPPRKAEAL